MIVKEGEIIMIKGSANDILFDLVAICYSIHKKLDMPKEAIAEVITDGLSAIDNSAAFIHEVDLTDDKNEGFIPKDFPAKEFFESQGCKNEDEYWEKIKKEMTTKRKATPEQADIVIEMLKKKFPFLNTVKKETTTQTTVTEDAANQFKSMFGDLLNE